MSLEIEKCRICGNSELLPILELGEQCLTGVFPRSKSENMLPEPVAIVKCRDEKNTDACGLVQMKYSYDHDNMFGENYGYRSGLNESMVKHLLGQIEKILAAAKLSPGDMIIDIGSNDSTLLQGYKQDGLLLVGVDPTGEKFRKYYPKNIRLIPEYFTAKSIRRHFGIKKAKIISSIAMLYDLEAPLDFAKEVCEILSDDGVWFFEQSYLPSMLKMNSYDTICHEHLEYYSLKQIKWITDKCGLKIVDAGFNDANGGSIYVIAAKAKSSCISNEASVKKILLDEYSMGLHLLKPYELFKRSVYDHRAKIRQFFDRAKSEGKKVFGYGASTKGNVLLQFCDLTTNDIQFIAEVNPDKFGCCTPGTNIPIISEEEARRMKPDYFMVLPWHFREGIIMKEQNYLGTGGKLVFPLPFLDIVSK